MGQRCISPHEKRRMRAAGFMTGDVKPRRCCQTLPQLAMLAPGALSQERKLSLRRACVQPTWPPHPKQIRSRPLKFTRPTPHNCTFALSLSLPLNARPAHSSFPGGFSACGAEIWQMNLLHVSLRDSVGVNYTGGSG